MAVQKHQFVVDDNGKKTAVILTIEEYEKLIEEAEELEAIRAYDAAKEGGCAGYALISLGRQRFFPGEVQSPANREVLLVVFGLKAKRRLPRNAVRVDLVVFEVVGFVHPVERDLGIQVVDQVVVLIDQQRIEQPFPAETHGRRHVGVFFLLHQCGMMRQDNEHDCNDEQCDP